MAVQLVYKYPEMGSTRVGIGYLIGRLKFRGVGFGVVTGSLLGGIFLGNFFHVPVSDQAKAMLFLLFLFGIGYSVGPSFFRSLKGDGWRWALLAVFVPVVGLLTAYAMARFLKLDLGFSAGLLSGSLTESPAIGTASEAIRALPLPDDQETQLIAHIAVADAICYIFGTIGVIWCCSSLGPKLLGINLQEEAKKLESNMGIRRSKLGVSSAWQPIAFRAYTVHQDAAIIGKTVAEAEKLVPGARLFVERIRRNSDIFLPLHTTVLEAGDTLAVIGRTEILVKVLGPKSTEVADPELLDIPVASLTCMHQQGYCGKTLKEIAERGEEAHGVLLRGSPVEVRRPQELPVVVERGDTFHVTGTESAVEKLAPFVGRVIRPLVESDLGTLGIAIFIGVLIGAAITIPIGNMKLTLGTSVGTLIAGLMVGWMRSVRPWFGGIPDAAILFMRSIGLAAFVAMVGLSGTDIVNAVRESGYLLFFGGIVVTLAPLISGIFFGRYVLRLNPLLLLGGIAGAQTMIAGVAAVEEKADSAVATLGYSYTAAIGHILLTTWGTVIVALMS
jgi:putative transport protein